MSAASWGCPVSKPSYKNAHAALLDELERQGWTLRRELKVPHATSPDRACRIWIRPQAVWVSRGPAHSQSQARSLHIDSRDHTPLALLDKAVRFAALL